MDELEQRSVEVENEYQFGILTDDQYSEAMEVLEKEANKRPNQDSTDV